MFEVIDLHVLVSWNAACEDDYDNVSDCDHDVHCAYCRSYTFNASILLLYFYYVIKWV